VNSEPMGNFENSVHNVKRNKSDDSLKTAPDARVLIVDDNDTNLLVAKSLLKRTLVKTDTCMSGKECIELIGQNIYDIVFLDHMMPEMDGIETLKKIKDEQLGGATKFVILTANAVQGAKQTYLDAGFDDYLSKPINGHDLEECLFRFLDDSLIVGGKKSKKKREERSAEFLPDISAGLANYGNYPASYMNAVYAFCDNNKCNDLELDFSVKDMGSYHVNLKKVISEADALGLSELKEKALLLEAAVEEKDEKRCSEMHKELISIYKNAADNLEAAAEKRLSERDDIN
ncbi:MAG: response regulator, partial [Huintestinicola sp.]